MSDDLAPGPGVGAADGPSPVKGNVVPLRPPGYVAPRKPMTDRRRAMIFRVVDDRPSLFHVVAEINLNPRCDEILAGLISRRLTGRALEDWFKFNPGKLRSLIGFVLSPTR